MGSFRNSGYLVGVLLLWNLTILGLYIRGPLVFVSPPKQRAPQARSVRSRRSLRGDVAKLYAEMARQGSSSYEAGAAAVLGFRRGV